MTHYHQVTKDLAEPTKALREAIPEAWSGFAAMHRGALADGVLPSKIKEVMALAIAVVEQCDGCIAFHAKAAARRGATEQEVAEGLGVALLMSGGPGTVYGPRAFAAFKEFSQ